MNGDYVLAILRNDLLSVRLANGRIFLAPPRRVTPHHRELVRKHRQVLIQALSRWPNSEAGARDFREEPPRPDELAHRLRARWQARFRRDD